jgi:hypothetical protein
MALDRYFQLRKVEYVNKIRISKQALSNLASDLAERPVLLGKGKCLSDPLVKSELIQQLLDLFGDEYPALFIPSMNCNDLANAFEHILGTCGNLYPTLHKLGFLVIHPANIVNNGVLLSGGSYSSVMLRIINNDAFVYKAIKKIHGERNIDACLRLYYEGSWLNSLPKPLSELFPKFRHFINNIEELGYEMDFAPMCSVAELVFQECFDGNQIFLILSEIYSILREYMYCRIPTGFSHPPKNIGYLEIIERRMKIILSSDYPANGILRALCNAKWVEVNGIQCPSPFFLLKRLNSDQKWKYVIEPSSFQCCHGDLILDNILASMKNPKEFRLVDPNPINCCVLFDLAKTMFSLWIGFEFIYYNLFSIDRCIVRSDGNVEVKITLDRPDCQRKYIQAANLFIDFIKHNFSEYLGSEAISFEDQIRMTSALQSLAIPMFYLLHHKSESQAIAFTCLGLYHASLALSDNSSKQDDS